MQCIHVLAPAFIRSKTWWLYYRISPNKRTRLIDAPPLDFLACNILFSQKLNLNPSSIADDIAPEERYMNK